MRVVMLGMAVGSMGGISTVERLLMAYLEEVEVEHISTFDYGSGWQKVKIFGRSLLEIVPRLVRGRVDVMHVHFAERGCAWRAAILTLLGRAFGCPVVLHAHACEFRPFYQSLPVVGKRFLGWVFSKSARFIALSESWKEFYTQSLGLAEEQVVVLMNPVELPEAVPVRAEEPVELVFLGRIGPRKGAFDVIEAYGHLPAAVKARSRLTLAGDDEVARARALVTSLGLEAHVEVLDWLSPAERDAQLAKSHIFLLPSRNEGLPMSLLEAMGWGLACVTTPVGGIPELVSDGDEALLVEPGDVAGLCKVMEQLIEDGPLREQIGQRGRARVSPLDIETYSRQLLSLYRAVEVSSKTGSYRLSKRRQPSLASENVSE